MFLVSVPFVSLDRTWTMVMVCAYKYIKKYFPSPGWYSFEVQFSNPCLACRPLCRRCLKALFSISPVPEHWRCPIAPLQQQLSEEKHFVIAFVVQGMKQCCMLSEQPPCCLPSMATTPLKLEDSSKVVSQCFKDGQVHKKVSLLADWPSIQRKEKAFTFLCYQIM